jgi:hypothetical protein
MIPKKYLHFIEPLVGVRTMLELGNKRGTEHEPYKAHFEKMGIAHTSIDWNGQDGAIAADLRNPLNLVLEEAVGRSVFDMVTNIGTSEHVSDQAGCWQNIIAAAGKWIVSITPHPGDWPGHGLFYPTRKFYEQLAQRNQLSIEQLEVFDQPGRRFIGARLKVEKKRHFVFMPEAAELAIATPRA